MGTVTPLRAQSTFGTLLGTVKDSTGAVVPGAKVLITNNDEGTSRSVMTDSHGSYEIVDAKPDHYTVSVSKPGFQTSQVTDLMLTARQTLRADISLPIGQITQSVTVQGGTLGVISTDTSTVSSSFGHLEITNLPTNYRASANGNSPYYLLTILPGVQSDNGGNLSIQGGLQSQSAFTVDGISTTDVTGNSPLKDAFPSAVGRRAILSNFNRACFSHHTFRVVILQGQVSAAPPADAPNLPTTSGLLTLPARTPASGS